MQDAEIAARPPSQEPPCEPIHPDRNFARMAGLVAAIAIAIAASVKYRLWEAVKVAPVDDEKIVGCNNTATFYTHDPQTGKAVDGIYLCLGERHHLLWNAVRYVEPVSIDPAVLSKP